MFKKIANSGQAMLLLYGFTFAIGSYTFYFMERTSLIDAYYWASTSMTTIGYGDVTAKTDAGKLFTIFFQQWSIIIIIPLTIAWVLGKVNKDAFTDSEQVDADEDRETIKAEIRALREELTGK